EYLKASKLLTFTKQVFKEFLGRNEKPKYNIRGEDSMRKMIILSISVIFLLLLAACGGNDGTSEASNDGNGDSLTLRVAGQNNEDHPNTIALEKMAETVSEKTDGRIE